jgi:hypothetical protein
MNIGDWQLMINDFDVGWWLVIWLTIRVMIDEFTLVDDDRWSVFLGVDEPLMIIIWVVLDYNDQLMVSDNYTV